MVIPDKIIRTNRRSISLSINKAGELVVHAPKRIAIKNINDFIKEKESWITKKQNEVKNINNKNEDIMTYKSILYLGEKYQVFMVKGIKNIEVGDGQILVPYVDEEILFLKSLVKWFALQTNIIVKNRVEYFAEIMQVDYKSVSLTKARGKWGSCDENGNLKFNYRLSMLTPKEIDYIIIHELCHLIEFNHSKKFYDLVAVLLPNYKRLIKSIKGQGYLLSLF